MAFSQNDRQRPHCRSCMHVQVVNRNFGYKATSAIVVGIVSAWRKGTNLRSDRCLYPSRAYGHETEQIAYRWLVTDRMDA